MNWENVNSLTMVLGATAISLMLTIDVFGTKWWFWKTLVLTGGLYAYGLAIATGGNK